MRGRVHRFFFSNLIKGLIGWGYWLTAPVFLLVAIILGFHRGRPVALRVFLRADDTDPRRVCYEPDDV